MHTRISRNIHSPTVAAMTPTLSQRSAIHQVRHSVQARLSIGASNDPLEQEADRVAERVMRMPLPGTAEIRRQCGNGNIQRTCAPCSQEYAAAEKERRIVRLSSLCPKCAEVEKSKIQRKAESSKRIQRFTGHATENEGAAPASVDRVLSSSGSSLDPALQQDMGQRFGYDFSQVRVHTGAAAEQSARDVNAHAYTVGSNIVFGAGQFAPESYEGRRLIAHELTHVVQQSIGGDANTMMPYQIEPSNNQYEQEADATADAVLAGHAPAAITPAVSSIQLRAAPYIKKITVHLTPPQSADLEWEGVAPATATGSDHFTVSTGKGYSNPEDPAGTCTRNCCSDAMTQCAPPWNQPSRVGSCCTFYGDSFWTGTPLEEHNGWQWWTPIQPYYSSRGIALHQHTEVTGQPIGHGCVRMDEPNAKRIYDYSNGRFTNVTIDGRAAPVACEPDRQCSGSGVERIQRKETTKASQPTNTNPQNRKVLVTGFNDWENLGIPRNDWICNANPSCRLLVGSATTSRPTSYSGPLVSQLSRSRNINWEFQTLPVTWGIAQSINYQNYDAVINMGLGVYDTSDAIQLEQGAYVNPSSPNAATTVSADRRSDVSPRVAAMDQVQVASQYKVRVAQARKQNNFICNETHAYALSELNRSFSGTPQGRLKLVYFVHLPYPRSGASGYGDLASGASQVINNLIR